MVRRFLLAGVLLLGTTPLMNASAASPWEPLVPGETVAFLIPEITPIPSSVVFSGGEVSQIDVTGCVVGGGDRWVQHYVVLDPTGTRSERSAGIIPLTTLPVQPSTRFGQLNFDHTCFIGTVLYYFFQGTVE